MKNDDLRLGLHMRKEGTAVTTESRVRLYDVFGYPIDPDEFQRQGYWEAIPCPLAETRTPGGTRIETVYDGFGTDEGMIYRTAELDPHRLDRGWLRQRRRKTAKEALRLHAEWIRQLGEPGTASERPGEVPAALVSHLITGELVSTAPAMARPPEVEVLSSCWYLRVGATLRNVAWSPESALEHHAAALTERAGRWRGQLPGVGGSQST